jgi:hypothetical protein
MFTLHSDSGSPDQLFSLGIGSTELGPFAGRLKTNVDSGAERSNAGPQYAMLGRIVAERFAESVRLLNVAGGSRFLKFETTGCSCPGFDRKHKKKWETFHS